jgi:hypothetical protein
MRCLLFLPVPLVLYAAASCGGIGDDSSAPGDDGGTDEAETDAIGADAPPDVPFTDGGSEAQPGACPDRNPLKNAYFGDLHAHTSYSLDAYSFATRSTPFDAYAFARGKTLQLAGASADGGGPTTTIERPLDFLAITDHSEWLAAAYGCGVDLANAPYDPTSPYFASATCGEVRSTDPATETSVFRSMRPLVDELCDGGECAPVVQSAWQSEQQAAASAYVPCTFTSFVGQEWSRAVDGATLHKNVIFATDHVPPAPIDSVTYPTQADLWNALETQCTVDAGCAAITVPHNSNMSQGGAFLMAPGLEGLSAKYQRLVEIFQHKGDSECFYDADAGVGDRECNFEYLGGVTEPNDRASYVRSALYRGIDRDGGPNPFMFGFIASTDDHNGTPGNTREDTWPGHAGRFDDTPEKRLAPPPRGGLGLRAGHNPGGLAVAWAEENTRESLFAAFQRRETYATSGTRILVRFYQTWSAADPCSDPGFPAGLVATGAAPMGGTFGAPPAGASGGPRFVVYAWKDKTDLSRIDVVKLWYDDVGAPHESIQHDVIPPGAGGARCFVWQDATFTPGPTVYYARVLENPTPRWSMGDCARAPWVDPDACADGGALNITIQERAWTSPIWYAP